MQHHAPDYRRFKGSVPPNLHLHHQHSPILRLKYYEKYWSGRKNQNQTTWHQHTHLAWYHIILYYMVGYIALYLQLSLHTRVLYLCGSYERCVCVCVWVNVFTCPTARGLYAGNLRGIVRPRPRRSWDYYRAPETGWKTVKETGPREYNSIRVESSWFERLGGLGL